MSSCGKEDWTATSAAMEDEGWAFSERDFIVGATSIGGTTAAFLSLNHSAAIAITGTAAAERYGRYLYLCRPLLGFILTSCLSVPSLSNSSTALFSISSSITLFPTTNAAVNALSHIILISRGIPELASYMDFNAADVNFILPFPPATVSRLNMYVLVSSKFKEPR